MQKEDCLIKERTVSNEKTKEKKGSRMYRERKRERERDCVSCSDVPAVATVKGLGGSTSVYIFEFNNTCEVRCRHSQALFRFREQCLFQLRQTRFPIANHFPLFPSLLPFPRAYLAAHVQLGSFWSLYSTTWQMTTRSTSPRELFVGKNWKKGWFFFFSLK